MELTRRRGAMVVPRQGRREPQCSSALGRLRTRPRGEQRGPAAQIYFARPSCRWTRGAPDPSRAPLRSQAAWSNAGASSLRVLLHQVAPVDDEQGDEHADEGDAGADDERRLESVGQRERLTAVPVLTASLVVVVAIADSAAMPRAPPICCDVLISPEASPASWSCTPANAAIEIGTNEKPMPTPISRKPGQQVGEVRAADGDLGEVDEAGRQVAIPTTSTGLTPIRVTSCAARADQKIAVPATAR